MRVLGKLLLEGHYFGEGGRRATLETDPGWAMMSGDCHNRELLGVLSSRWDGRGDLRGRREAGEGREGGSLIPGKASLMEMERWDEMSVCSG